MSKFQHYPDKGFRLMIFTCKADMTGSKKSVLTLFVVPAYPDLPGGLAYSSAVPGKILSLLAGPCEKPDNAWLILPARKL